MISRVLGYEKKYVINMQNRLCSIELLAQSVIAETLGLQIAYKRK